MLYPDIHKELLDVWTRRVLNDLLSNNTKGSTIMNSTNYNIFDKIKLNFDETRINTYINKITLYI